MLELRPSCMARRWLEAPTRCAIRLHCLCPHSTMLEHPRQPQEKQSIARLPHVNSENSKMGPFGSARWLRNGSVVSGIKRLDALFLSLEGVKYKQHDTDTIRHQDISHRETNVTKSR
jgi:hypothetical protein